MINIFIKKKIQTVIAFYGRFFVLLCVGISCGEKETIDDKPIYTGPIMSLDSVNVLISDSALVVLKRTAAKELHFANRNSEWPEGLTLVYYDKNGEVSSTFRSDYAFYNKDSTLYHGSGNVMVRNVTNGDELSTEELFWDAKTGEFYTKRFVTIRSDDEIHTGEGLTANQDFSMYTIHKPAGTFTIENEIPPPTHEVN